jgi:competence protein ComGC
MLKKMGNKFKFRLIEMHRKKILMILGLILVFAAPALSQDEEKIQQLFQDAIQAMGGETYLNVTDMVSKGQWFAFDREGQSSGLIKYTDYTKLPDKSRFEEGNRKKDRDITVFNLATGEGWIKEGRKEAREATPEEIDNFKRVVKHTLDIIFRQRYKDPENKLFYLGPGEGRDVVLELVKILDPENDEVVVYFDRISKLPEKIEYWDMSGRGVRLRVVEEFSQWVVTEGVNTPMRIDQYVNGRRSSQHFVLEITYNNDLPDSLFSRPVSE